MTHKLERKSHIQAKKYYEEKLRRLIMGVPRIYSLLWIKEQKSE